MQGMIWLQVSLSFGWCLTVFNGWSCTEILLLHWIMSAWSHYHRYNIDKIDQKSMINLKSKTKTILRWILRQLVLYRTTKANNYIYMHHVWHMTTRYCSSKIASNSVSIILFWWRIADVWCELRFALSVSHLIECDRCRVKCSLRSRCIDQTEPCRPLFALTRNIEHQSFGNLLHM